MQDSREQKYTRTNFVRSIELLYEQNSGHSKMKLAFCLFKYFPFGGLQRDFISIAKECLQRGHTVDVFVRQWEGELDPALPTKIIASKGWQNHTRNKNFVVQLQQHLAQEKYDLVIGFNKMPGLDVYFAADTCWQAKANVQHGAWYRLLPRYRHLIAYENAVFGSAEKTEILLISKAQQSEFMHYYHTDPKRFHLLPPGIRKDRIAPQNSAEIRARLRREFNLSDNELLLLLVGSGFKTKGLDRILLGIAALPEDLRKRTKLFIIGQDNPKSFQHQAKQLGIINQIKFLAGRDDVPRFLWSADLLVHPAYNENTGTVLLEAVVSGLPVLTTAICGYADYIEEAKAGVVLGSPYSQTQFNQMLANMLLSTEREKWRQNGLAFALKADIYSMSQRAVDVIESLKR